MRTLNLLCVAALAAVTVLSGCVEYQYTSDSDGHEYGEDHEDEDENHGSGAHAGGHVSGESDGPVTVEDCEEAYEDADPRFHNKIEGTEEVKRTISVEAPASGLLPTRDLPPLRVAAILVVDGQGHIMLRDPYGRVVAEEKFEGHKELEEEAWFETQDAEPGDWTLSVAIEGRSNGSNGEGAYTFGAYQDG